MPYYKADADAIAQLGSRLQKLGQPVMLSRKYRAILNAIEVQIEDEYTDAEVTDMLFESLLKLTGSIDSPAGVAFGQRVAECQKRIAKRLAARASR